MLRWLDRYVIGVVLFVTVSNILVAATLTGPTFARCTSVALDMLESADPLDRAPPASLVRLIHEELGPRDVPLAERRFDFSFWTARLVSALSECDGPQTLSTRLLRIPLGWWLRLRLGERDVIGVFVSQAYLGRKTYGFAAAARFYYGRELGQLSESEQRCLARKHWAPSDIRRRCNGK